ncbi:MAG TPA: hypothetical protein VLS95_04910 [Arthrobacter sp.]|nr:hypothetical protein [Arthrobacter sp.]
MPENPPWGMASLKFRGRSVGSSKRKPLLGWSGGWYPGGGW